MKSVDLSMNLVPGVSVDERTEAPVIHYTKHTDDVSLAGMVNVFSGTKREDFEPYGWASERVRFSTHTGTHLNAPWHFWPKGKDGAEAKRIDEFPLEWGIQQGVVLNLESLPAGVEISCQSLKEIVKEKNIQLDGKTVLLYFGGLCGKSPRVYLTAEALKWLCEEHDIHVLGTEAAAITDEGHLFACSQVCGTNDVFVIENMEGLEKLPQDRFEVVCFPQKVKSGSAAWCRAFAWF